MDIYRVFRDSVIHDIVERETKESYITECYGRVPKSTMTQNGNVVYYLNRSDAHKAALLYTQERIGELEAEIKRLNISAAHSSTFIDQSN